MFENTVKEEKLTKKVDLVLVVNANIFSKVFVRVYPALT